MNKNISINELQDYIKNKDYKPQMKHQYFLKLIEEIGELSEVIRKEKKSSLQNIKGTIEEELYDVLYYTLALANIYDINMEASIHAKEKINNKKYQNNEIIYNKLIRDNIPTIIEDSGKNFTSHISNDKEYKEKLFEKVIEELNEFKSDPSEEEMGDILEVLDSITKYYNLDPDKILKIKQSKKDERGGFDKKIILEKVFK